MTRRQFVVAGGAVALAATGAARPVSAAIARGVTLDASGTVIENKRVLSDGWELFQGSLAGPWEVWHSEELAVFAPVAMPHCFNAYDACDPDVPYYRGQGWYRTRLAVANPFAGGRTLLHFLGAGQASKVWIGETLVGEHEGGYDEWVVDVTDAVDAWGKSAHAEGAKLHAEGAEGGVPLCVMCSNERVMDRAPSDFSDFSLYGGLYRHVELVYVPRVSIESVRVDVQGAQTASPVVNVSVMLSPGSLTGEVGTITFQVFNARGKEVHIAQPSSVKAESVEFSLKSPQCWSPETPDLYTCSVRLGMHVQTVRFGIRHFEFEEHGPFKLNGERLLLRGTHRHEDHAGFAAAMPDAVIEQELRLIKAMGANFIRLGHYQQNRRVLELCDELGILVWEEIPWCRAGIGDEHWTNMVREKLTNMIAQHRNHPSVILWGLGNEDDWPTEYPSVDKAAIRAFMTELRELAHKLDPSRLTSYRRCDFARDIPDVYSPSIWAGWYSGQYRDYQASLEKQAKLQPRMLHIEWGADSHAGRHAEDPYKLIGGVAASGDTAERGLDYKLSGGSARISKDGDWSETYACDLFDWHLKVQESLPWLAGAAQWIFKDFTTPLRVENPVPRVNQKGVVARDLTPKESYFVFQSYWAEAPMLRIYGHTWPVRWGAAGERKLVKVYSNCDEVELFHAGTSVGVKRRDPKDFPCAGLRWMVPFTSGPNTLRAVGKKAGKTISDAVEFSYETRAWGAAAKLLLRPVAKDTVEVTLTDAAGVTCLDSRATVRFSLSGTGKLVDNQGTPWGSRVVQLANGRARIAVRSHGVCTVGVESEGLAAAFVELT